MSIKNIILLLVVLTNSIFINPLQAKKNDEIQQLKEDIAVVWPLAQTVKIEYELASAQLEFCKTEEEKKAFMETYEEFIKENYFKKVLSLNLRQGKLLLSLIDREIGKTPFELLRENRTLKRAMFWQRFAKLTGANLKEKYKPKDNPLIEYELKLINLTNTFPLISKEYQND